jgi:polysaccharide export outer membrane protein
MILKNRIFSYLLAFFLFCASLANASNAEFVILPGDVLNVTVWKEEGMDQETLVLPDGTINFPLVGSIHVRNKTPRQVQDMIVEALSAKIPDASVTVSVKAPLGHTVSVLGQVREPGDVVINSRMSVMRALSQVGGLTPFADEDDIIVIRTYQTGKKERIEIPYDAISRGRKLDQDIELIPGDVVIVPTAGLF